MGLHGEDSERSSSWRHSTRPTVLCNSASTARRWEGPLHTTRAVAEQRTSKGVVMCLGGIEVGTPTSQPSPPRSPSGGAAGFLVRQWGHQQYSGSLGALGGPVRGLPGAFVPTCGGESMVWYSDLCVCSNCFESNGQLRYAKSKGNRRKTLKAPPLPPQNRPRAYPTISHRPLAGLRHYRGCGRLLQKRGKPPVQNARKCRAPPRGTL